MSRRRLVTLDKAVRAIVKKHGSIREVERVTGIDKSFISRHMNGYRTQPSDAILTALGLHTVPLYEVIVKPKQNVTEDNKKK
jgi:hypothetical protein